VSGVSLTDGEGLRLFPVGREKHICRILDDGVSFVQRVCLVNADNSYPEKRLIDKSEKLARGQF
jgi:hypothetical protein